MTREDYVQIMNPGQPEPRITPLDKTFGALVTNVRLNSLEQDAFATLYDAWLSHALLIFPGQHLSKHEQITFARLFGELVEGLEAAEISNVKPDASLAREEVKIG